MCLSLSLCVYTYMYVHEGLYVFMCLYACPQRSEEYVGVLYCSFPAFSRQILSLNLRLTVSTKLSPHRTPKICLVLCPTKSWGYTYALSHLPSCECWGLNSSHHSCSVSTLVHHHPAPEFFNNTSVSFWLGKNKNTCTIYHPYLEPQIRGLPDLKCLHT